MRRWFLALAAATLVGCPAAVDTDEGVDPAVLDESFRFCHDAELDLPERELDAWCDLLDEAPEEQCPGLREACAAREDDTDPGPPPSSGCGGQGGGSGSVEPPEAPQAPTRPAPSSELDLTLAEGFVSIVRWTVAFLVAAVLVGLLYLLVRVLVRWFGNRRVEDAPTPERPAVQVTVAVPDPDEVPDAPVGDLLSGARAALAAGRLEDAVLLARGASLRSLGNAGRLRLHRSRTDREYVRALRREKELQGHLRAVVRAVEDVRWGGRRVSAEVAAAAVEAASRVIAPTAVLFLVLGALLALPGTARADEYALDGAAALPSVFERYGFEVSWRLRTVQSVDDSVDVLVLDTWDVVLEEDDGVVLRQWVEDGGLLVVSGLPPGFPELGTLETWPRVEADLRVHRHARDAGLGLPRLPGHAPDHVFRDGDARALVVADAASGDAAVIASLYKVGRGAVVAVSDSRVFRNGFFLAPANVTFVGGLPWAIQDMGWVDLPPEPRLELVTIGGSPSGGSPLGAMANARLLPFVLQLLLLLAVVALWRGWPFGPLRDPPSEGRLLFAEHAEALGRRLRRVGASRHVASTHADLWLRRLGPVALQAAAERHGYSPEQARDLVSRARALADDPDGPDGPGDLDTLEELWRITKSL